GRTKPNIVSLGRNAVFALPSGAPAVGSGTSYSNPNVAGLILCLWQAFPEFSNMDIMKAVEQSSNRYEQPDNRYGYGIPNFRRAFGMLVQKRILASGNRLSNEWLGAYPVPFKSQFNLLLKAPKTGPAGLRLVDISGKVISVKNLQVIKDNFYYIPMSTPKLKSGVYVVVYWDGANKKTLKIVRE
ncbi:MAG TPA: T9SS type A sorting domain-containing protein, partial [Flavitalea sp.]|nr:T9SS type A sorting domain-containing protein [Flavitalea sp.]